MEGDPEGVSGATRPRAGARPPRARRTIHAQPSHYDVLGISRQASLVEIKRAFYARARLYHPDAHVRSPLPVQREAERKMQALNAAWNVLRDPARRRRYDRALEAAHAAAPRRERLAIGSAFQSVLGTGRVLATADGRTRFNLRLRAPTSLEPLAALAPDRLVGLHADGFPVGDDDLRHLAGMTGLRVLDLSGTAVTDRGLAHLVGCPNLETLLVWDTAISDAGLKCVGRLANLRQLGLGRTAVTDDGLVALAGLRRLRLLQLWGTEVTGPGLVHLHGLGELELVTLPWRVRGRPRRSLRAALAQAVVA